MCYVERATAKYKIILSLGNKRGMRMKIEFRNRNCKMPSMNAMHFVKLTNNCVPTNLWAKTNSLDRNQTTKFNNYLQLLVGFCTFWCWLRGRPCCRKYRQCDLERLQFCVETNNLHFHFAKYIFYCVEDNFHLHKYILSSTLCKTTFTFIRHRGLKNN